MSAWDAIGRKTAVQWQRRRVENGNRGVSQLRKLAESKSLRNGGYVDVGREAIAEDRNMTALGGFDIAAKLEIPNWGWQRPTTLGTVIE